MKKILIVLAMIVAGVLTSCTTIAPADKFRDVVYGELATDHSMYVDLTFGAIWDTFQDVPDVSKWVTNYLTYIEDIDEEFSDPEAVLKRGYGDCDDYALLVMNIVYYRFGIKLDLILLDGYQDMGQRVIIDGGSVNHATVGFNGIVFNVYDLNYLYKSPIIGYAYSFDYVFTNQFTKIPYESLI